MLTLRAGADDHSLILYAVPKIAPIIIIAPIYRFKVIRKVCAYTLLRICSPRNTPITYYITLQDAIRSPANNSTHHRMLREKLNSWVFVVQEFLPNPLQCCPMLLVVVAFVSQLCGQWIYRNRTAMVVLVAMRRSTKDGMQLGDD